MNLSDNLIMTTDQQVAHGKPGASLDTSSRSQTHSPADHSLSAVHSLKPNMPSPRCSAVSCYIQLHMNWGFVESSSKCKCTHEANKTALDHVLLLLLHLSPY